MDSVEMDGARSSRYRCTSGISHSCTFTILTSKAMPYSGLSTLQVPEYGHEDLLAKAYTFQASSAASRYSILSY